MAGDKDDLEKKPIAESEDEVDKDKEKKPIVEAEEDEEGKPLAEADDELPPDLPGVGAEDTAADPLAADIGDEADDDLDADMDVDAESGGESSPVDITPEVLSAITKVVQGYLTDKDEKKAIGKIKHLFATHKAVMSEAIMAVIEKDPATFLRKHPDQAVRTAGRKILIENTQFKNEKAVAEKRAKAIGLCKAAALAESIIADEDFIGELMDCSDEALMQRKIRIWQKTFGTKTETKKTNRPKSAGQMDATAIVESTTDTPAEAFDEKKADEALDKLSAHVMGAAALSD